MYWGTFSIVGYCERTGMVGMAIATKSICVAARCVWVEAGAGAVATQNLTDPRLGKLGLELLKRGYSAPAVLEELIKVGAYPEYRQLALVDCDGLSAAHTGSAALSTNNQYVGKDVAAAGNLLAHKDVITAMGESFESNLDLHMAERLLRALEEGKARGGEVGGEHSAGLKVAHKYPFPLVDLRVDYHDNPVAELRNLWTLYEPQMQDYVERAIHPDLAPPHPPPE